MQKSAKCMQSNDVYFCAQIRVIGKSCLNLKEFWQNYAFSDVTKLRNVELPIVNGLNRVFANKGNCGKKRAWGAS